MQVVFSQQECIQTNFVKVNRQDLSNLFYYIYEMLYIGIEIMNTLSKVQFFFCFVQVISFIAVIIKN